VEGGLVGRESAVNILRKKSREVGGVHERKKIPARTHVCRSEFKGKKSGGDCEGTALPGGG